MNDFPHEVRQRMDPTSAGSAAAQPTDLRSFTITVVILLLCFSFPLYQTVRFGLQSELYSHLLLIPFVSAYLAWLQRSQFRLAGPRTSTAWAVAFVFAGSAMLAAYLFIVFSSPSPAPQDALAFAIYALVFLLVGTCCWFLNRITLRAGAFPLSFLFLFAPFPVCVEVGLETFLQHGSSVVADLFFQMVGTPVFRDGTLFHLPGFSMQVAPECSGIHSTLALFITSLVAGQVLLRSTRSRVILALAVPPIALLRNGLRVTTIGELCVRIGPEMIDSFIHRHGGPIFFVISLVPFAALLLFLIKRDHRRGASVNPAL